MAPFILQTRKLRHRGKAIGPKQYSQEIKKEEFISSF